MKDNKKNVYVISIIAFVIFLTVIAFSYSYLFASEESSKTESMFLVESAKVYANYSSSDQINIDSVFPQDNVIGYKEFSVTYKNTGDNIASYYVNLDITENGFNDYLNDGVLYYELLKEDDNKEMVEVVSKRTVPVNADNYTLLKEEILPHTEEKTVNYLFNMYFPKTEGAQGGQGASFSGRLYISGEKYKAYKGELAAIEIDKNPDKVDYKIGESFLSDGMSINALLVDGKQTKKEEVTGYTVSPSIIGEDTKEIEIAYTLNGIIKSAYLPINIIEN